MKQKVAAILLLILFWGANARAQIDCFKQEDIYLATGKTVPETSFSNGFKQTDSGLSFSGGGNGPADAWIQSGPIQISDGKQTWETLNLFFLTTPFFPDANPKRIAARFSTDKYHWSEWKSFQEPKPGPRRINFFGFRNPYRVNLEATQETRQITQALFKGWQEATAQTGDTHASFLEWIARTQPGFLEKETPFINFVQVRVEWASPLPSFQVESLHVGYNYIVSGIVTRNTQ
jgi:hypothetical protein